MTSFCIRRSFNWGDQTLSSFSYLLKHQFRFLPLQTCRARKAYKRAVWLQSQDTSEQSSCILKCTSRPAWVSFDLNFLGSAQRNGEWRGCRDDLLSTREEQRGRRIWLMVGKPERVPILWEHFFNFLSPVTSIGAEGHWRNMGSKIVKKIFKTKRDTRNPSIAEHCGLSWYFFSVVGNLIFSIMPLPLVLLRNNGLWRESAIATTNQTSAPFSTLYATQSSPNKFLFSSSPLLLANLLWIN